MSARISPALIRKTDHGASAVCCANCSEAIVMESESTHWKDHAVLATRPVNSIPGWSAAVHPDLILREFACGACGHLLDSEMALPEDPFLYDIVRG